MKSPWTRRQTFCSRARTQCQSSAGISVIIALLERVLTGHLRVGFGMENERRGELTDGRRRVGPLRAGGGRTGRHRAGAVTRLWLHVDVFQRITRTGHRTLERGSEKNPVNEKTNRKNALNIYSDKSKPIGSFRSISAIFRLKNRSDVFQRITRTGHWILERGNEKIP